MHMEIVEVMDVVHIPVAATNLAEYFMDFAQICLQ